MKKQPKAGICSDTIGCFKIISFYYIFIIPYLVYIARKKFCNCCFENKYKFLSMVVKYFYNIKLKVEDSLC